MSLFDSLTVEQIASLLEDAADVVKATVYIEPPENAMQSYGDSDDEEVPTGDINKMSGNQLRAGAELVCSQITESGIETFRYGEPKISCDIDDIPPSPEPSLSKAKSSFLQTGNSKKFVSLNLTEKNCNVSSTFVKEQNNVHDRKENVVEEITNKKQRKTSNKIKTEDVNGNNKKRKTEGRGKEMRKWEKNDINDQSTMTFERAQYLQRDFTPVELFELFFDNLVVDFIVECTNEFAVEKGNESFSTTRDELRLFFAILFLSGYNTVPRTRMYWESADDVHNNAISKAISRNRFEEIMRYIHFCKNSQLEKEDRFGKIRPVMCMLNERWLQYFPGDPYLSVDESMVPYYGRYGAKQHIHGKPIRFGYKVWILATRLGYVIHGEPYQGKNSGIMIPGLGLGGSVVMDLLSELPEEGKYCVFFDNFFTSFRLLEALKKKGHYGTGTVRADRVKNAPLPDPKVVKKEPRGTYHQLTDQETGITVVRYNDNSVFTMASTVAGVEPLGKAKRWSNSLKKHITVDQPSCVSLYNLYMGGIDRMDENIAAYRINIRNKKWYWPMISYLLSVSMNNAWLIYRMTPKYQQEKLDFLGFTRYIVRSYLVTCSTNRPSAGRPSQKAASRVPVDVRYSGSHFLESIATNLRCAHCGKATRKRCKTCQVGCHILCNEAFHLRPL